MQSSPVIYLDYHATTPVDPRVLDRMLPYFSEDFGNPSSVSHAYGHRAADAVESSREQIAKSLGTSAKTILFTSGATEANNLAINGVLARCQTPAHLITSAIEHRAVLDPMRKQERNGHELTILPVNEFGEVDPNQLRDALCDHTRLVSIHWANNEIGTIQKIAEIGAICRERGVLFHADAAQAVGKLPIDLSTLPIDLMSFTAHKFYGSKGVGALYVSRSPKRVRLEPWQLGGGQENGIRSGTLPVPLIVGFAEACRIACEEMPIENTRQLQLREELRQGISNALGDVILNGHPNRRLAGNLNLSIPGVDGDALMMGLTKIAVSSGSACSTHEPEPSHVLKAIGRSDQLARSSLRFGLGRSTTTEHIQLAIDHVVEVVTSLRQLRQANVSG